MKANLLDGVGDIGVGQRQVLEDPGEALELSRISNRRPESGGDLSMRVHGHRDQLAVHHASAIKDVESELALSGEESIDQMLYGDPQKMVKRIEVRTPVSAIGGGDTVESDIRVGFTDCFVGKTIQQIRDSVEPNYPVANWERCLKEQGVNHIIYSAKSMLGFTVLRRGVGAAHPQNYPMSGEECSRGGVV
jgi:hypothetical protein